MAGASYTRKYGSKICKTEKDNYFCIKPTTRMKICISPIQVKNDSYMAVRPESFDTSFPILIRQVPRAWWNPELLSVFIHRLSKDAIGDKVKVQWHG